MSTTVYGIEQNTVPDRIAFSPYHLSKWTAPGMSPQFMSHADGARLKIGIIELVNRWAQFDLPNWVSEAVSNDPSVSGAGRPAIAVADYDTTADPPTVQVRLCDDLSGNTPTGAVLTVVLGYPKDENDNPYRYPNVRSGQVIQVASRENAAGTTVWEATGMHLQLPIGSLWMTTQTDIPVGWVRHAEAKFLVGYKVGDGDYDPVGSTGGSDDHTHDTHPDHKHYVDISESPHNHTVSLSEAAHNHSFSGNVSHDHAIANDNITLSANPHTHAAGSTITVAAGSDCTVMVGPTAGTTLTISGCADSCNAPFSGTTGDHTVTVAGNTGTHTVNPTGYSDEQVADADASTLDLDHSTEDHRPQFISIPIYRRAS